MFYAGDTCATKYDRSEHDVVGYAWNLIHTGELPEGLPDSVKKSSQTQRGLQVRSLEKTPVEQAAFGRPYAEFEALQSKHLARGKQQPVRRSGADLRFQQMHGLKGRPVDLNGIQFAREEQLKD